MAFGQIKVHKVHKVHGGNELTGIDNLQNLSSESSVEIKTKATIGSNSYDVSITSDGIVNVQRLHLNFAVAHKVGPTDFGSEHQTSQSIRNTVLSDDQIPPEVAAKNIMKSDKLAKLAKVVLEASSASRAALIITEVARLASDIAKLETYNCNLAGTLSSMADAELDHVVNILNELSAENRNSILNYMCITLVNPDAGKSDIGELCSCIILKMKPEKAADFLNTCSGHHIYTILQCEQQAAFTKKYEIDFIISSPEIDIHTDTSDDEMLMLKGFEEVSDITESIISRSRAEILAYMDKELESKIQELSSEEQQKLREVAIFSSAQSASEKPLTETELHSFSNKEHDQAFGQSVYSMQAMTPNDTNLDFHENTHQELSFTPSSVQSEGMLLRDGTRVISESLTDALRTTRSNSHPEPDSVSNASFSTVDDDEFFDDWMGEQFALTDRTDMPTFTVMNERSKLASTESINHSLRPTGTFNVYTKADASIRSASILPRSNDSLAIEAMKEANKISTLKAGKLAGAESINATSLVDSLPELEETIEIPELVLITLQNGLNEQEHDNMINRLGDYTLAVAHTLKRKTNEITLQIKSLEKNKSSLSASTADITDEITTKELERAERDIVNLNAMLDHPLSQVQQRILRDGFVELLARFLMLENEQEEFKQQPVGIKGGKKAFALKINKLQQFREALDNQSWESVSLISGIVKSSLTNARKKDAYIDAVNKGTHQNLVSQRTYADVSLDGINLFGGDTVSSGMNPNEFDDWVLEKGLVSSTYSISSKLGDIDDVLIPKKVKIDTQLKEKLFTVSDDEQIDNVETLREQLALIEQQVVALENKVTQVQSEPKASEVVIEERRNNYSKLKMLYLKAVTAHENALNSQPDRLNVFKQNIEKLLVEMQKNENIICTLEDEIQAKEAEFKADGIWGLDRLYTDSFSEQERMRTHAMSTELRYFIDSTRGERNKVKYFFPKVVAGHAKAELQASAESKIRSKWKDIKLEEKAAAVLNEYTKLEERVIAGLHEVLFHSLGHRQYCVLSAVAELDDVTLGQIRDHLVLNNAVDIPRPHKRIIFEIGKEIGMISKGPCSKENFIEDIKLSASPFQRDLMIALAVKAPETFVRLASSIDPMTLTAHELYAIYEGCRMMMKNPVIHAIVKQCTEFAKYKAIDKLMPPQYIDVCLAAGDTLNKQIQLLKANSATKSDQTPSCITKIPFDKHKVFDYSDPKMQLLYALSFAQSFMAGAESGLMDMTESFMDQGQGIMNANNPAKFHITGLAQQVLVESQPEYKDGECYQNIYFSAAGTPGNCLVNTDYFQPRGEDSDWNYKKKGGQNSQLPATK